MTTPRLPRRLELAGTFVFVATALALAAPPDARAQGQRASAPLAVSATVVRSCVVEAVDLPVLPGRSSAQVQPTASPGPAYRLRCGKQTIVFPVDPGPTPTPLAVGRSVRVGRTADGRTVLIQF